MDLINETLNGQSVETITKTKIAVAKGDGIGPEIMDATLRILNAAGAKIDYEYIELGEKKYLSGSTAGIDRDAGEEIRSNKIIFKAPITTIFDGLFKKYTPSCFTYQKGTFLKR